MLFFRRVLSYYFTVSCGKIISPFRVNVKKISIFFSMLHTLLAAVHAVIIPEVYILVHVTINTILLLVLLSEVLLRVMAHGSGFFHPLINKWEVASITGSFFCMIGYWITLVFLTICTAIFGYLTIFDGSYESLSTCHSTRF